MYRDVRAKFEAALASALAGDFVADSFDLDDDTIDALERIAASAPNADADLVQAARREFDELLADLRSVEQRAGEAIPAAQLRKQLGLES